MEADTRRSSITENNENAKLTGILNNPEYISPYDDLAFEMYVHSDIAKIIREMEIKKHLAVISMTLSNMFSSNESNLKFYR